MANNKKVCLPFHVDWLFDELKDGGERLDGLTKKGTTNFKMSQFTAIAHIDADGVPVKAHQLFCLTRTHSGKDSWVLAAQNPDNKNIFLVDAVEYFATLDKKLSRSDNVLRTALIRHLNARGLYNVVFNRELEGFDWERCRALVKKVRIFLRYNGLDLETAVDLAFQDEGMIEAAAFRRPEIPEIPVNNTVVVLASAQEGAPPVSNPAPAPPAPSGYQSVAVAALTVNNATAPTNGKDMPLSDPVPRASTKDQSVAASHAADPVPRVPTTKDQSVAASQAADTAPRAPTKDQPVAASHAANPAPTNGDGQQLVATTAPGAVATTQAPATSTDPGVLKILLNHDQFHQNHQQLFAGQETINKRQNEINEVTVSTLGNHGRRLDVTEDDIKSLRAKQQEMDAKQQELEDNQDDQNHVVLDMRRELTTAQKAIQQLLQSKPAAPRQLYKEEDEPAIAGVEHENVHEPAIAGVEHDDVHEPAIMDNGQDVSGDEDLSGFYDAKMHETPKKERDYLKKYREKRGRRRTLLPEDFVAMGMSPVALGGSDSIAPARHSFEPSGRDYLKEYREKRGRRRTLLPDDFVAMGMSPVALGGRESASIARAGRHSIAPGRQSIAPADHRDGAT